MKKIHIFLLLGVFQIITAKVKETNPAYLMPNGLFSVYFLDSVQVDNYCIVESGINHHLILIPDSNYQVSSYNKKYWNDENCIFYFQRFFPLDDYMVIRDDNQEINHFREIWPYKIWYAQYVNFSLQNKKDEIKTYAGQKPSLFARFFITGEAYNYLSQGDCIDCLVPEVISFKNPFAYYFVYVPIR